MRRRTQAERIAASDKAMYQAAIRLIAQKGVAAITMAQVGKEAGFTGGLVSHRFGSKAGLIEAVTKRTLELWESQFETLDPLTLGAEDYLHAVARRYFDRIENDNEIMHVHFRLMQDCAAYYPDLVPLIRAYDDRVRTRISQAVSRGSFDQPDSLAVVFMAMLRGVAQQYFTDPQAVDLVEAHKLVRDVCSQALKR